MGEVVEKGELFVVLTRPKTLLTTVQVVTGP
jgi:hypothetical protein